MDHPTVYSLVALSHNMLFMKSIDFHRLPFILLLLKSWMKIYWALWQCYSSIEAKKTLSSSVTLWANGLRSYTKAASFFWTLKEFATLIQNWFEMFSNIACLILIQNIFVFIMAELLFFHLGCRRQSLTEGQPNLWIGTFS